VHERAHRAIIDRLLNLRALVVLGDLSCRAGLVSPEQVAVALEVGDFDNVKTEVPAKNDGEIMI
jgi:hypothetical protein